MSKREKKVYEIHGGAVTVNVRIKIYKKDYYGVITASEVDRTLKQYLNEENKDAIEII
jgi:hypothetical protein